MSSFDIGLLSFSELVEILTNEENNNVEKSFLVTGWDAGFTEALSRIYGLNPQKDDKNSERLSLLLDYLNKGKSMNVLTASTLKYINLIPQEEMGENINLLKYIPTGNGIINDKLNILFIKKFGIYTKLFIISFVFLFLFFCAFFVSGGEILESAYKAFIASSFETFIVYKIYMLFWRKLVTSDPSNLEAKARLARRMGYPI